MRIPYIGQDRTTELSGLNTNSAEFKTGCLKIPTTCTSNNPSTEAPRRKMGKKARGAVGMSNREGCQTPGGQGKMMA